MLRNAPAHVKRQRNMICSQSKEIGADIRKQETFRMDPVIILLRSHTKIQNDYISEDWPTSAKIPEVHRCALPFETVRSLMEFLGVFEERVVQKKAGSIKEKDAMLRASDIARFDRISFEQIYNERFAQ